MQGVNQGQPLVKQKETLENRIFSSVSDKNKQCGRWDLNPIPNAESTEKRRFVALAP